MERAELRTSVSRVIYTRSSCTPGRVRMYCTGTVYDIQYCNIRTRYSTYTYHVSYTAYCIHFILFERVKRRKPSRTVAPYWSVWCCVAFCCVVVVVVVVVLVIRTGYGTRALYLRVILSAAVVTDSLTRIMKIPVHRFVCLPCHAGILPRHVYTIMNAHAHTLPTS
jgi:ABC-type xylose transport system permease subunit